MLPVRLPSKHCAKLFSTITIFCLSVSVQADVYKFVDANGHHYYSNQVGLGPEYRLIIKTPPRTYRQDLKKMPINKNKYGELISRVAERHQMDPKLIHAVIQAESAYNPSAVSPMGAVGMMQLMPDTARRYGVIDRYDVEQNIEAGTRYLKDLLAMFGADVKLALAGFNAGEGSVLKYNRTIPPYPETQSYVQQVLSLYSRNS